MEIYLFFGTSDKCVFLFNQYDYACNVITFRDKLAWSQARNLYYIYIEFFGEMCYLFNWPVIKPIIHFFM